MSSSVTSSLQQKGDASVAILMCTYNGARFLEEQLNSFAEQTHTNWRLWVSDDGSTDETLHILEKTAATWGPNKLTILQGPRKGYVANFLSLICSTDIAADYVALSDQDDVWLPEKIAVAVHWLKSQSTDKPALYCSRTTFVDDMGVAIGQSPLFSRKPGFGNALVESLAGGNTMVMNVPARQIIMKVGVDVRVPSHDWWIYIAITACGGHVFYDPQSHILYRQHGHNIIGSNRSLTSMMRRLTAMLAGEHRPRATQHIAALEKLKPLIPDEQRSKLELFCRSRDATFVQRVVGFIRLRPYRQTLIGTLALCLSILLRRL